MAANARILEDELKQYTINTLNNLIREVDSQFGKWSQERVGFLALLCSAQQQAIDRQAKTLKEDEEERRRSYERSMFVFSLVSIGATAWLGSYLEQRLGPKLFKEYEQVAIIVPKAWLKTVPNEFASKVFGDSLHALADKLLDPLGERLLQPPSYKAIDPGEVAGAPDANTFASSLFRQVDTQRKQAGNTIGKIAEAINNSVTFGGALVKLLVRQNPRFKFLDSKAQQLAGHKLIDDMLYAARRTWADKWLFYGSDPPALTKSGWDLVITDLERQMWLVWIVQQNFHLEADMNLGGDAPVVIMGASGPLLSRTGVLFKDDSAVSTRLFELNAPITEIMEVKMVSKAQVDQLNAWAANRKAELIEGPLLRPVPRPISAVNNLYRAP